jgi:hypothetical protein
VQDAVKLPIFDAVVMANLVFNMVIRPQYEGYL